MIKKVILVSVFVLFYCGLFSQSHRVINRLIKKAIKDYSFYYKNDTIRILLNEKYTIDSKINKPIIVIIDSLNVNKISNNTTFIEFKNCYKSNLNYFIHIATYTATKEGGDVIFNFTGNIIFSYSYDISLYL